MRPDLTGVDVVLLLSGTKHTAEPLLAAEPQSCGRALPYSPPARLPLDGPTPITQPASAPPPGDEQRAKLVEARTSGAACWRQPR
ncbi:hypothetical protein [Nonomuraea sp. SBT364]|uniref:hypothetical protein n=1 Tax=Nonomuraea sp. SBT364 TaxID=1580530 RepID=UPI00066E1A4F|nr:hypothetical protein [Nonomuraea sp. SBT364]